MNIIGTNNNCNKCGSWRNSQHPKLFGREQEIKQLSEIVDREQDLLDTSSLIVIRGLAGSGKSSLIRSYPWQKQDWQLSSGKFEAHRTAEPYSAVTEAMEAMIQTWMDDLHDLEEELQKEEEEGEEADDEDDAEEAHFSADRVMKDFQDLLQNEEELLKQLLPNVLRMTGVIEEVPRKSLGAFNTNGGGDNKFYSPDEIHAAFRRIFLFLLSSQKENIVLFLDDIQWADEPSLNLLQSLILGDATGKQQECIQGLLLAVSYRQEEVQDGHPILKRLQDLEANHSDKVVIHTISIEDLDVPSLNMLVSHLVRRESQETLELTQVIHNKTAGNPFFVLQFLTLLQYEKFLKYNYLTLNWEWDDVSKIQNLAHISDNVADVVAATIHMLPKETQVVLQVASCLGRKVIPLQVLTEYFLQMDYSSTFQSWTSSTCLSNSQNNKKPNSLDGNEQPNKRASMEERVLFQTIQQNDHGLEHVLDCAVSNGILIREDDTGTHKWSHDKLQQFAHAMVPKCMRATWHLRLGKLLWKLSSSKSTVQEEWMVFTAADQLNRYYSLQQEQQDDEDNNDKKSSHRHQQQRPDLEVARLNLAAAKLSMKKSALFPAMDMLQSAAKHLEAAQEQYNDDKDRPGGNENKKRHQSKIKSKHSALTTNWSDDRYDLCLEIYSRLSEIAVQVGQHDIAMVAVQKVEDNAKCVDDKFRAHCAMLTSITCGDNRDYDLGVEKTIEILKMYGERLYKNKTFWKGQLFWEKQRLKSKLPGGNLDGLLDLPTMVDSRSIKVTKLLLQYLSFYAIHSQRYKGLRPLTTLRSLNIACNKGLCEMAASAVLGFAIDLKCAGHYQEGLNYGKFAIGLVDKFPQRLGSSHCTVRLRACSAVFNAILPFSTNLEPLLEAHRVGLVVGDTEKALCAIVSYSWAYWCVGLPIGPFQSDLVSYGREAQTFKLPYPLQVCFKIWQQAVLNLQEEATLKEDECKDEKQSKSPTILIGDAMDQEEELKKVSGGGAKMTLRDINTFRLMLACIYNDWEKTAPDMVDALEEYLAFDILVARAYFRTTYLGLASFVLARKTGEKKYWNMGKRALAYFKKEARHGSVNAFPILTMLEAEENPSKDLYEKSIKTCARLGLSHHEAYMCERAGLYFLREEKDVEWGRIYLDRALSLYKDWGATRKVNAMMMEHANTLTPHTQEHRSRNTALKGRRRFTKRDSNLLKAIMGMVSRRAF